MNEVPEPAPSSQPSSESSGPSESARHAATVVLLREATDGPEAFLLRRVRQMEFAGGMTVFPGGGVDDRDTDRRIAWTGPEPAWWARRFGCTETLARALVCAAVRETFEEAGVLLAGPSPETVVGDVSGFATQRAAVERRELSFAEFLVDNDLVLRADLLRPWANWITPTAEPRRFDTRFFVAALPAGQRADGDTSEADHAMWRRPADALADHAAGRGVLLPPTWATLNELAAHPSLDAILAAAPTIEPIQPELVTDGGPTVRIPETLLRRLPADPLAGYPEPDLSSGEEPA